MTDDFNLDFSPEGLSRLVSAQWQPDTDKQFAGWHVKWSSGRETFIYEVEGVRFSELIKEWE
jgi:hypothetical protein